MKLIAAFHRLFETATWRKKQAALCATQHFQAYDQQTTAAVLRCLVELLGVDFEQLHPHTDLARDLRADEEEPEEISLWLHQHMAVSISAEQVANSQSIGGLVELVASLNRHTRVAYPSDGVFF